MLIITDPADYSVSMDGRSNIANTSKIEY